MTRHREWMAAVLYCGPNAFLSHLDAAALYGVVKDHRNRPIHVSLTSPSGARSGNGITVHHRRLSRRYVGRRHHIPVTSIVLTLVDIATQLNRLQLERAVSEADSLGLVNPDALRAAIDGLRVPGAGVLRRTLDPFTFRLTDSVLEQLFLEIVRRLGLPLPQTRRYANSWRVDFYWPELGLVVEVDSLTYHRNAIQQTKDVRRDQAHAKAGVERLRFTHHQVKYEPREVEATLAAVTTRLLAGRR